MAPSASAASSPSSSLASHVATVHPSAEQINASGARLLTAKTTARGPGCARKARAAASSSREAWAILTPRGATLAAARRSPRPSLLRGGGRAASCLMPRGATRSGWNEARPHSSKFEMCGGSTASGNAQRWRFRHYSMRCGSRDYLAFGKTLAYFYRPGAGPLAP